MKRYLPFVALLLAMFLLPATLVTAGTDRSPSKDTTCQVGGACADNFGIQPTGSNLPAPCSNGQLGYIGWDLSGVSGTVSTAELTLTTYSVTGAPASPTTVEFQLVEPNTQSWTENGNDPGLTGNVLATTSAILANGSSPQTVTFGGSSNPADATSLGTYFEGLKGSGNATVGIRISGGCTLNTFVAFNDSENSGGLTGGAAATEPDLILFSPTAIGSYSFRAGNSEVNVMAGLIAVALVVGLISALVLWRRKPAELSSR